MVNSEATSSGNSKAEGEAKERTCNEEGTNVCASLSDCCNDRMTAKQETKLAHVVVSDQGILTQDGKVVRSLSFSSAGGSTSSESNNFFSDDSSSGSDVSSYTSSVSDGIIQQKRIEQDFVEHPSPSSATTASHYVTTSLQQSSSSGKKRKSGTQMDNNNDQGPIKRIRFDKDKDRDEK